MKHPRLLLTYLTVALATVFVTVLVRGYNAALSQVITPASIERAIALAVLTEVSTRTVHGAADDLTPNHILAARLNAGEPLTLTCGYVSALAQSLLANVGIEARRVMFLTKAEFDGNNGHVGLEIYLDGEWLFVDPDFGRMYSVPVYEMRGDRSEWVQIGEQYANPEDAPVFPRHIDNGVLAIEDGDHVVFDCEDMRPDLVSHIIDYAPHWYQCLPTKEWLVRFYG